jgi:hypothetical protein
VSLPIQKSAMKIISLAANSEIGNENCIAADSEISNENYVAANSSPCTVMVESFLALLFFGCL